MNKVFLIGNLTKDPEISTTPNGVSVCNISIAVSRRFSNKDGVREADFFNITVWEPLADNCHKFLRKGSKVAIEGNLRYRNYDAPDGTRRYVIDIVAENVEFLSTKNSGVGSDAPAKDESTEEVTKLKPVDDDGLPF